MLTVARYIYNCSRVYIFTTLAALIIIIVNFGLVHNLMLTTVDGLNIKHQVGDLIIVLSR